MSLFCMHMPQVSPVIFGPLRSLYLEVHQKESALSSARGVTDVAQFITGQDLAQSDQICYYQFFNVFSTLRQVNLLRNYSL